jgi:ABC-type glycerol-3-phosphate transport system substrate-binding protein
MLNLRPFQIFLIAIFVFLALLSIVLLSLYEPNDDPQRTAFGDRVIIWGTLPYRSVADVIEDLEEQNPAFNVVEYVDVRPDRFAAEFVNAIAEGRSPDLVLLPHTELVAQRSKLLPIPYTTTGYSERDIRNRFIDGVEIFARPDGLYAIPLAVDPLIMYWNRDLFASAGFAVPPQTWEQFVGTMVPQLTVRDSSRNIQRSAAALGEYQNIRHGYEILSLLLLQAGSRMVTEGDRGYELLLNEAESSNTRPLESVLQFYSEFANPVSALYTWNRSLEEDQLAFTSGDLATYFGLGSEARDLVERNPNLNFDATLPPQGANATVFRTHGTFYGFAIPRASRNQGGAFNVANFLASQDAAFALTQSLRLTPVDRTLLARGGSDSFAAVSYQAALIARGWLSPSPAATEQVFQTMVEEVAGNRNRISNVVNDTIDRLLLAY